MGKLVVIVVCFTTLWFLGLALVKAGDIKREEQKAKYQDTTALYITWEEYKLEMAKQVMNSERTVEEKIKVVEEIMRIPRPEFK